MSTTLSDNIKNFRKFRFMTQKELAAQLGLTVTTVANWEQKNPNFSVDTLVKICKVLRITPNQLLGIDPCEEYEEFKENCQKNTDIKRIFSYAQGIRELKDDNHYST